MNAYRQVMADVGLDRRCVNLVVVLLLASATAMAMGVAVERHQLQTQTAARPCGTQPTPAGTETGTEATVALRSMALRGSVLSEVTH